MKLKDAFNQSPKFLKETLIGKEIAVLNKRSLILGLAKEERQWDDEIEDGPEIINRLMVLHEVDPFDFDEWEEEEFDEEPMTNRQTLIDSMEEEPLTSADIACFIINNKTYTHNGYDNIDCEDSRYEDMVLLQHFLDKECISSAWQEKELDSLLLTSYEMEEEIWDVNWEADILDISVGMETPIDEVPVSKVIRCSIGHYDLPKSLTIEGKDGQDIEVKIHGLFLYDIWENPDSIEDEDIGEFCDKDERLLLLNYETEDDIILEFYTKEYLDAEVNDYDLPLIGVDNEEWKGLLRIVDIVPKDFDDEVELELLSYSCF